MFKRITRTVNDRGQLIHVDEPSPVNDYNVDWYESLYDYTPEQKKLFDSKGTVAGIDNVSTKRLLWDFDSSDIEKARQDACTLVSRLIQDYDIAETDIVCAFSGNKGFHVSVALDNRITVEEFKTFTQRVASDLPTYDIKISNSTRIIRLTGTKHATSGLFKTHLTAGELQDMTIAEIQQLAQTRVVRGEVSNSVLLDKKWFVKPKEEKKIVIASDLPKIDFFKKPKGWTNCKWALHNGYTVHGGERHEKLMCLVATAKALNYSKEGAYYVAKEAAEKGYLIHGGTAWDKKEFYNRDFQSIYNGKWQGGTYSCKDGKTKWLTDLCNSLGAHACKAGNTDTVACDEVFGMFENYANHYEDNIIRTGIAPLDEKVNFLVGTSVGILAPPGVGKTSLSLQILKHNSEVGINSVFFSYDMFHSMVYMRLIQKEFGLSQDEIFSKFKTCKTDVIRWRTKLSESYKNVKFCFKSGQTADELYETVMDIKNSGVNLKLVVVDYNELVQTGVSDPTQSSAIVAQRLRQIANDTETCVVTLLQPAKQFSNPADEASTYQAAKGSGAIAQSLSMMLSLSRPGFHPRHPEDDGFFTINALKNRQGPLFTKDFAWDGLKGEIAELSPEGETYLAELRVRRAAEKANTNKDPI